MKAPAADQAKLLKVQAHDTELHQLAHKRAHLPALQELAKLRAAEDGVREELVVAGTGLKDIQRDLVRLEDEIGKVRARTKRDQDRLDSGGGTSRELIALQLELETLERRRNNLEDEALDVMEALENARAKAAHLQTTLEDYGGQAAAVDAILAGETAEIDQAAALAQTARDLAVAGLDSKLVQLYERMRERLGGVGAAALVDGRCEGCGMELSASDLAGLRALAPDEVARCEECNRILVRDEGSGL